MTTRDPLLMEVLAALGDVDLRERYIPSEIHRATGGRWSRGRWIQGEQSGKTVTVNPAPDIVDTVIHELIHYVRPEWSERSVQRRTTQIMRQITDNEVKRIYQEYVRRVVVG